MCMFPSAAVSANGFADIVVYSRIAENENRNGRYISMVELKEIGESNYKEVLALDVDPDQKSHVAPNVVSLAQAWVFRDVARPFAIFAGDTVVGFAMLEVDLKKPSYDIWRFMIDRHHQRKGYGRAAMERILAYLSSIGAREVRLSYVPGNTAAQTLYAGCGFEPTGEVEGGEIVMKRVIRQDQDTTGKEPV